MGISSALLDRASAMLSCQEPDEPIAAWTLDELDDSSDLATLRYAVAGADG